MFKWQKKLTQEDGYVGPCFIFRPLRDDVLDPAIVCLLMQFITSSVFHERPDNICFPRKIVK